MTALIDDHLQKLRAKLATLKGSRRHRARLLGIPATTLREFEEGKGCTVDTIRTIERSLLDPDGKRAA